MRLPDITHGQEHQGSIQLNPNIPEQVELAQRIDTFLRAVGAAGIAPNLRSRSLKDYRVDQPNGRAAISAGFSSEAEGRYSAEVRASHKPSGATYHYSLISGAGYWRRNDSNARQESVLNHADMVGDMLEYAPGNGAMAALQDRAPDADAIMGALFKDMSPSAHFKAGSDHYSTAITDIDSDGSYASTRRIELIHAQLNRKVSRQLSITALTNFGEGPVDITQKLIYEAKYGQHGQITEDAVRLVLTSSDGMSPIALTRLAETSDVGLRSTDLLHTSLDELSRAALVHRDVA